MRHQRISQEEFFSCRCSTTILVETETMNKNVWQTLDSYFCMQENLVKDNGHSLVLVPKCGLLSVKTVHKEFWDKIAEKMLIEFAESGCPKFPCNYTIVQRSTQKQRTWSIVDSLCSRPGNDWDYFSHNCFCKPAQSRYVKNTNSFTKERDDLLWWGNQSCSVRSRPKFLWIVMTQRIKIAYCNNMENELNGFYNKIISVTSVWMQDFWMFLKLDNTSGRMTLQISHNFMQWLVVNTLFQEKKKASQP